MRRAPNRLLTRAAQQRIPSRDREGVVFAGLCKLLVVAMLSVPLTASTVSDCAGLRHHGQLAEAKACYAR